jgi:hypothetical protein
MASGEPGTATAASSDGMIVGDEPALLEALGHLRQVAEDEYRLGPELARGGMGRVVEGWDQRHARPVAIKLLLRADRNVALRFAREAAFTARLEHPNIVALYEAARLPSGEPFLALRLVRGRTLAQAIDGARTPAERRALVPHVVAVADALGYAHGRGIVHRDLKPANVLVGEFGETVVIDWGVAKQVRGEDLPPIASSDDAELTVAGKVVGTPAWMAPEQARGEPATPRCDVYAIGMILAQVASGARLGAVVARATAVDPAARPADGAELARELRAALRPSRWPLRGAVAGGAVALALAAGLAAVRQRGAAPRVCPPPGAGERQVDAAAPAGGTGSAACPQRTITEALAAEERPLVVHIAAGRYDRALGERFPLVVRGGVTLAGAGADATHIIGTGAYEPPTRHGGGTYAGGHTLVIGDPAGATALRGLSLEAGGEPEVGLYGVTCDSGNLAAPSRDPDLPASTVLADVAVGPGYEVAVLVSSSTTHACNLRLERARIHGNLNGVFTAGCASASENAWADPMPYNRLEVVDSTFTRIHWGTGDGYGLVGGDCLAGLEVRGTRFEDGDSGLAVIRHPRPAVAGRVVVEKSSFARQRRLGLALNRGAILDRLVDCFFIGNSAGPAATAAGRAVAILIDGGAQAELFPQVRLARGNTIFENDVGIELRGDGAARGTLDFGRADDPGRNLIRCNATIEGSAVPGHDILVRTPMAADARLWFAGNVWDHAPPTSGADNGADVVGAVVDAAGATAGGECKSRVR